MSWGNNHSWEEVEDFDSNYYEQLQIEWEQYDWEMNQDKNTEDDKQDD